MSGSSTPAAAPESRRDARQSRRSGVLGRVLRWALAGLLLLLALGAAAFAFVYAKVDVPEPNDFASSQSTILYYADGETELGRLTGGYDRESVPLSDVPDHVQKAMLAAEDRNFYDNEGVSPVGIARAAWRTLTTDSVQGGSTITQQYVKNYYLTADQTLERKLKELMISIKIDRELSKDEILENYLNTIFYGRSSYGIQTAAHAYFDKDASELDLAESVFLAAVTNSPANLDPAEAEGNQERAEARFEYVLDGMVEEGWLSAEEREGVQFPTLAEPSTTSVYAGPGGYVANAARNEIARGTGIDAAAVDSSGLRVVTTIDQAQQQAAVESVAAYRPTGAGTDDLTIALVAMVPGDGAITAMYGGDDYQANQLNAATDARVQAGSLFKPITLTAAVEDGEDTLLGYEGPSPMYFNKYLPEVRNFQDISFGWLDLRTALAYSVNTIFVQLNEDIGPEKTVEMAVRLGLPENTPGLGDDLTNVLGTSSPTLVEMTKVYSTLAAQGKRAEPYLVRSVTSPDGEVLYESSPKVEQVVDPAVVADVVDAMQQVMVGQGSGAAAGDMGRPVAGKSGTSENNVSAWFDGFTPQLTAAVLIYKGEGTTPMHNIGGVEQVTGGTFPVEIWAEFMRRAMEGKDVLSFPPRVGPVGHAAVTEQAPATVAPDGTDATARVPAPAQDGPVQTMAPTDGAVTTVAPGQPLP